MATFSIKVDASAVQKLAQDIGKFDGADLGEAVRTAINETTESAYKLSRETILRGINLTEGYVERRMETRLATKNKTSSEIVALGGKKYLTNLSHYGARTSDTNPVKFSNEWIAQNVRPNRIVKGPLRRKPRPGDPWATRDGSEPRGIPAGQKAYKMSAEVVKGARKSIGKKFILSPKIKDTEGNPLVFSREGSRIDALYGPSVYQLFRSTIPLVIEGVGDELERNVLNFAEREFRKIIE